ncbi:MAG TPA: hypothetical protein VFJ43_15340 [Bacteroidia bacterium]|nr:hypothetical protein [Bacteroidia bacterium]
MKRLIFFLVPIIFLSACSDFYHLHYKKLDKIPVQGYVAPLEIKPRQFSDRKKICHVIPDTLKKNSVISEKQEPEIISVEKEVKRNYSISPKVQAKSAQKISGKTKIFPQIKNHQQKFDGAGFFVILILLFCLALIVGGGFVFVIGIYAGFWVPILIGLLMICLGIFPVIGFIGFMIGDRHRPVENYEDEGKKIN